MNQAYLKSMIVSVTLLTISVPAASLAAGQNLDGRILIAVENKGQLWYVSPLDHKRHLISNPISEGDSFVNQVVPAEAADIDKLPLAKFIPMNKEAKDDTDADGIADGIEIKLGTDPNKADTDGDGYDDKTEILSGYDPLGAGRLTASKAAIAAWGGRVVWAIGSSSVWYVSPIDGSRILLLDENISQRLAKTAIGVSNATLAKIPTVSAVAAKDRSKITDCGESLDCMAKAAKTCSPAQVSYRSATPMFTLITGNTVERIIGAKDGQCVVDKTSSNIQVALSKNATAADKDQAATIKKSAAENGKLECIYSNDRLSQIYTDSAKGTYSFNSKTDSCTTIP